MHRYDASTFDHVDPALGGDDALAQRKTFLTLSSGSPGGAYYPLGGGMAVIIEKTVEGFRCASESTGASVENSRLVGNGVLYGYQTGIDPSAMARAGDAGAGVDRAVAG